MENNGRGLSWSNPSGENFGYAKVGSSTKYNLIRLDLHTKGEHIFGDNQYNIELQFVGKKNKNLALLVYYVIQKIIKKIMKNFLIHFKRLPTELVMLILKIFLKMYL